jgi:adenylate cyclase
MAPQDFKRKLTAILSADVKGYSRLMGEDEEATVRTITAHRKVITSVIEKYRGRVVDSPGDNILAEFVSVVDAAQSAVEIQEVIRAKNAELPEERRMEFRIGINLGDVIQEGERIYGDGVNIAARVEGLADPGGICISGSAYEQIENKLALGYDYIGEHTVKNIVKPIRVYRVPTGPETLQKVTEEKKPAPSWQKAALAVVIALLLVAGGVAIWKSSRPPTSPPTEIASVEKMAFPLPDKPSIAVLPFNNLSGDPEQEYFSDGLTEEIISALSRVPKLFVIARNSTFTYKGKPIKVQQVSEELGVRYVLEGSVKKAGDEIRITAQLIDALTGHHLWAGRYDRNLSDLFAVQDEITKKIITAMQVKLTEGEQARAAAKGTNNLEAYLKYLQAKEYANVLNIESNALARQSAEEAIALDPEYAMAYKVLGRTHMMDVWFGTSKSPKDSMAKARELVQKAIVLDDTYAEAYALLGFLFVMAQQDDKAIALGEKAVALNPNSADAHFRLGKILSLADNRWKESIPEYKKAIRLNPIPPNIYLYSLGLAYASAGQHEEGIAWCEKAVRQEPDSLFARIMMTVVYSYSGRNEEARAEAAEVLRLNPKFSLEKYEKKFSEPMISALRKAGLPNKPSLPLPDKPSIAVLAFDNMSADPEQEYLADGITEHIIFALSKISKLFVIARHSSFTYKGKPVKVQQIGRELGVRYVMEGSVQRAGDRLRITAQLIDATTGNHLWSNSYIRELKDLFAVQDDITKNIITAIQVKLTEGEQARAVAKGTDNLEAYLKCLQANEYLHRVNPESNALGKQLAEEAVALDPEYAWAYYNLGRTHQLDVWLRTSKSPKQSIGKAIGLMKKAIALDDTLAVTHGRLGFIYSMIGQYDKGIAEAEKGVAVNPNSAMAHVMMGKTLSFAGRWEESIPPYKKAIRLNPIPPNMYLYSLGLSYAFTGQYEEAITWCEKAVRQAPDSLYARIMMTVVYSWSGQDEKARAEAAEVLRIQPKYTIKKSRYKRKEDGERFDGALRKAGLT